MFVGPYNKDLLFRILYQGPLFSETPKLILQYTKCFVNYHYERLYMFPKPCKLRSSTYLYSIEQGTTAISPVWISFCTVRNLESLPVDHELCTHPARKKPHIVGPPLCCAVLFHIMFYHNICIYLCSYYT